VGVWRIVGSVGRPGWFVEALSLYLVFEGEHLVRCELEPVGDGFAAQRVDESLGDVDDSPLWTSHPIGTGKGGLIPALWSATPRRSRYPCLCRYAPR
jgi:hypothetical protein